MTRRRLSRHDTGTAGTSPAVPVRRARPAIAVVGVVAALLVFSAIGSLAGNAKMRWEVVGAYFFSPRVLEGLGITVLLTVIAMAVGIVLGTLIALARLSDSRILQAIAIGYSSFFRGIPVLIQVLLWFNLALFTPTIGLWLPFVGYIWQVPTNEIMNPMTAAVLGLGLNQAAYTSEVVRAGILSVPREQRNAGLASGLTPAQAFGHIVLPQAVRIIVPPIGNEVIGMLKATSIVSVVALHELLYTVELIFARTGEVIPLLLVATTWYLVVTAVLTGMQWLLERRLARSEHSLAAAAVPAGGLAVVS